MISERNRLSINYFSNQMLRDIIKGFSSEDISRFNKEQLIDKIVDLSNKNEKINCQIENRVFLPGNVELLVKRIPLN